MDKHCCNRSGKIKVLKVVYLKLKFLLLPLSLTPRSKKFELSIRYEYLCEIKAILENVNQGLR